MKNFFLLIAAALCCVSVLQCSSFYAFVEKAKEASKPAEDKQSDENKSEEAASDGEVKKEKQRKTSK